MASSNQGIVVHTLEVGIWLISLWQNMPLFLVEFQNIVACFLHLIMNTCRILLRELLRAINFTPTLVSAFEKILKDDMKIHLDPMKKGLLSDQVAGSQMRRTDYINVIEHNVHSLLDFVPN